jgi:hypothetical protein
MRDYTEGYDAKGKPTAPVPLASVQLAEAILCDDMPALSGVQLGLTSRSASRSYDTTISNLPQLVFIPSLCSPHWLQILFLRFYYWRQR